jgi:hypothetical protein
MPGKISESTHTGQPLVSRIVGGQAVGGNKFFGGLTKHDEVSTDQSAGCEGREYAEVGKT